MKDLYWTTTFEKLNNVCEAGSMIFTLVTSLTLFLYFLNIDEKGDSRKKSLRRILIIELIMYILCVAGYVFTPPIN